MQRFNSKLIDLRPVLNLDKKNGVLPIEEFQNNILRPIIKFQHHLIIELSKSEKHFPTFDNNLTQEEFFNKIKLYVDKNNKFKFLLIGLVIGLLTDDEIQFYSANLTPINKRISNMIIQRLSDTL